MAVKTIKMVQGNTVPFLLTAKRQGVAIDVTGATVVLIVARGTTIKNTGHQPCTLITPTSGVVQYAPQATDFDVPGTYKGELKVVYANGTVETLFDIIPFNVRKRL